MHGNQYESRAWSRSWCLEGQDPSNVGRNTISPLSPLLGQFVLIMGSPHCFVFLSLRIIFGHMRVDKE